MNHHCDPTCKFDFNVKEETLDIVARSKLEKGAPLNFHYPTTKGTVTSSFKCAEHDKQIQGYSQMELKALKDLLTFIYGQNTGVCAPQLIAYLTKWDKRSNNSMGLLKYYTRWDCRKIHLGKNKR